MKAIGIDIGTTSICLVLYEKEENRILESVSAPNRFLEGSFRQDADAIVTAVKEKLEWLLDKHNDVDVIGVSTQMHGIVYTDTEGKAVSPFYTWKEECGKELFHGTEAAEWLSKETGYPMYSGYGTVTHFVLGQKGEIPKSAVGFVNIGDYLVMQLCNLPKCRVHCSVAASFGGFNLFQEEFDKEVLTKAGVNTTFYPEIEKEGKPAGYCQNIPVMAAVGDNQTSFYAAAGEEGDVVSINVGTGSQVSLSYGELKEVQAGEIRPFMKQSYLYVQASVNGGKVYEKLAAFFEEVVELFTGEKLNAYEKMAQLGSEKEKTDLIVAPALYGARGKKDSFGFMQNLTAENFHPQDLIRAYVSGMAQELYNLYSEFPEELRKGRTRIVASGNGLRKNKLLVQEVERKFGMKVTFGEWTEEAATGAAMMAIQSLKTINE